MADERIPISYYLDPGKNEIHRKKGEGDKILEDKIVATYNPDTQVVTFPNLAFLKGYKTGVITFLAENELLVKSFQRGDMEADKPAGRSIPPRPKKTKHDGDKTPAVVQWYYDYKPNEFATRYGVLGRYTGPVHLLDPTWEPRPVDKLPEYRGVTHIDRDVVNVLVATRATVGMNGGRLTYTPDECTDWDEEEPEENEERERGAIVAGRSRGGDE